MIIRIHTTNGPVFPRAIPIVDFVELKLPLCRTHR